jgi:hypothetical protein
MKEKKYTSTETVANAVAKAIREYVPLIPGCNSRLETIEQDLEHLGSFYLSWERSWVAGCTLHFSLKPMDKITNDEGVTHVYKGAVQVSWSSTGRTPSGARAAIALYIAVTDLAAQIETLCDDFGHIGNVRNLTDATNAQEVNT